MEQMHIERIPANAAEVTVFKLNGPFTLATMFPFQAALREPALKGVIVDLTEVPYIDSAALGILLGHWSNTQRMGYKYALVGLSARVHTIFEITHTDDVLPIFPTQADAEKSFAASASAAA